MGPHGFLICNNPLLPLPQPPNHMLQHFESPYMNMAKAMFTFPCTMAVEGWCAVVDENHLAPSAYPPVWKSFTPPVMKVSPPVRCSTLPEQHLCSSGRGGAGKSNRWPLANHTEDEVHPSAAAGGPHGDFPPGPMLRGPVGSIASTHLTEKCRQDYIDGQILMCSGESWVPGVPTRPWNDSGVLVSGGYIPLGPARPAAAITGRDECFRARHGHAGSP
ncbi:hypothetical protein FQN60_006012 [Etheostoma spectabile]|uniref:Uncharacterized protein n=1 Tax=Etheostoma spectabile TaxID=54343 RepID=A0A5J5CBX4_9PERO|nr:hypothetical protein FQN60_006012 [Etheostoma spectabile]